MDPRLVAEGRPYYNWTFGHLGDDIAASLRYLERRFRPVKRALVSVSLSAIPARRVLPDFIRLHPKRFVMSSSPSGG